MKKANLVLIISLMIMGICSCQPSIQLDTSMIIGSWEKENSWSFRKYTFNEDGTYTYEHKELEIDPYVEKENGTYTIEGTMLILDVEQDWDNDNSQLIDEEDGLVKYMTIGVTDSKLVMDMVFYGGNKETLVGTWESYTKQETDTSYEEMVYVIELNKDGTSGLKVTINYNGDLGEMKGGNRGTTWELSDTEDKIIITDDEGDIFELYFMIMGDGIYFVDGNPVEESDYYSKLD